MSARDTAAEGLLDRLIRWAAARDDIRRLLLVGSRARDARPDDLADIDVQVYTDTAAVYTQDNRWLSDLGEVWVCVRDEYIDGDVHVPTRLVIFSPGVKVDFAFYPAAVISGGIRDGLPSRTLFDKDPSAARATKSAAPGPGAPTEAEFRRVVEEFWFEAYHVAKYLARGELWLAKSRDWATKQFLLTMIAWHGQFVRRQAPGADDEGRRATFDRDTWHALRDVFAGFAAGQSWSAASATQQLFRRLASETAAALGFEYPRDVDSHLFALIESLRMRHT